MVPTQYCFSITWRVLQSLPPSVEFLEGLVSSSRAMSPCTTLHSLILCPRTGHKVLSAWIKDSLVKQGQTTVKAENLLKNVSTKINEPGYGVKLLKELVESLSSKRFIEAQNDRLLTKSDMPEFVELLLLDAILAKVQMSVDGMAEDKESAISGGNSRMKKTKTFGSFRNNSKFAN